MTQDKLDVLADSCWEEHNGLNTFNHVKFAALVAAHEREKFCALLRQIHDSYSLQSSSNGLIERGEK